MNTERNSDTTVNKNSISTIVLALALGLFVIISIETVLFYIVKDSDILNQESEWYFILKGLRWTLPIFPFLFLISFYVSRLIDYVKHISSFTDKPSWSPSYNYPSFFGSRIFRRIMRILLFLHLHSFGSGPGDHSGGFWDSDWRIHTNAMLFCLFIILISRLIERDNKSIIHE